MTEEKSEAWVSKEIKETWRGNERGVKSVEEQH